jgi:preprotein translocase subunit SecB
MSKILNLKFPSSASTEPNAQQFNQLLAAVQQIVLQLNSAYTPQATEDNQTELDWFTGHMGPVSRSTLEDRGTFAHGMFYDTTDQTQTAVNTAKAITWNSTAYAKHISVGSPTSRIVFSKAGRYKVEFTAQLNSKSASAKTFYFWPRINGVNVPGSTMEITTHDNLEAKTVARAGIFEVNNGDYLEAMWEVNDTNANLEAFAASAVHPAVPSVTLVITSIEHG